MFTGLKKYLPLIALITGMSLYLYTQFEEIIECPSCHLFVDSADGLKNYFTPAYFVKHDSPGLWSHGMNYPYGEHVVYTDNQPIVSLLMKVAGVFVNMDEHVIGTINMLMILSILFTAILLFLLMRALGLPGWYAAILSIPIALLSPQIARFNGHYSLAYTYYIPMFLLLLVQWSKSGLSLKKGTWLVAWIVFIGFTHLYYFFISMVFLSCFAIVHFILGRFRINKSTIRTVAVVVISTCIVYGTVKLTDPVKDRPVTVYGLDVYTAKPVGAFLPSYRQADKVWETLNEKRPDIEGTSYIGAPVVLLIPFLMVFIAIFVLRRYVVKRSRANAQLRLNSDAAHPFILFLSVLLVWLIATGWMYKVGGGILVEWFPVIGQFRSLGRLAWIFYYIMGISTVYGIYIFTRSIINKYARGGLIVAFAFLTVFWIWEGHMYLSETVAERRVSPNKTFKQSTPFSDLISKSGFEPSDFQAILTLPLTTVGAEKIMIDRGGWFMRQSWQCAWESGLPIVNSVMSRTSISQTLSLIQITSDPYIEKARVNDMDSRPLILLASNDPKPLLKFEKRIIALADSIGIVNDVRVFTISVDKLQKSSAPRPDKYVYSVDFDGQKSDVTFSGQGALYTVEPRTETFSFVDTITTRGVLEYSSWSYLGPRSPVFASIRHEVWNKAGSMVKREDYNMHRSHPHNVIGDWIETSFYFSVDGSGAVHKFYAEPAGSWIDHIRIK